MRNSCPVASSQLRQQGHRSCGGTYWHQPFSVPVSDCDRGLCSRAPRPCTAIVRGRFPIAARRRSHYCLPKLRASRGARSYRAFARSVRAASAACACRRDFERTQARGVIEDLRRHDQLVGLGLLDHRCESRLALCAGSPITEHASECSTPARSASLHAMSRVGGGNWPGVPRRRLMNCCCSEVKSNSASSVRIGGEDVDADHRVRLRERLRRPELRAINLQRREQVVGREVRRERERQARARRRAAR